MDAAKYIKEALDSVFQFQLNIALEKQTYPISTLMILRPLKKPASKSKWSNLLMEYLILMLITEYIHVYNPTSKEFVDALNDDNNDVVDMINNNHCLEEELEDEVEKQDDIIDIFNNDMTISKFEEVFAKIEALRAEFLHPYLVSKSHGHDGNLMAAYKNLMLTGMNIQGAQIQENALKTKNQIKIKNFSK